MKIEFEIPGDLVAGMGSISGVCFMPDGDTLHYKLRLSETLEEPTNPEAEENTNPPGGE